MLSQTKTAKPYGAERPERVSAARVRQNTFSNPNRVSKLTQNIRRTVIELDRTESMNEGKKLARPRPRFDAYKPTSALAGKMKTHISLRPDNLESQSGTGERIIDLPGGRHGFASAPRPGQGYNMLVLTRKPEEAIKIGDDITVKVLGTRGGRVTLWIQAPSTTSISRGEREEVRSAPGGIGMSARTLSRKQGERVRIGENIVITVTKISNNGVKLGTDAPRDVPVHKLETYEAIQRGETPPVEADDNSKD